MDQPYQKTPVAALKKLCLSALSLQMKPVSVLLCNKGNTELSDLISQLQVKCVHLLVKMMLMTRNLIMKNALKKKRDQSLQEEVERAMNDAELEAC